jgi:6-phosphogluconolactonase
MPETLVYIGTYTDRAPNASKGIYAARFDPESGRLSAPTLVAELENPSFVAVSPDRRFLYAVSEVGAPDASGRKTGFVAAYAIGADGKLSPLNRVPSNGADPCHIAVSRSGRTVAVANYTGGSTASFLVNSDGSLGTATTDQHVGHGPNTQRQEQAHAHSVDFAANDHLLLSCDLGADAVYLYRHDDAKGSIAPRRPASVAVEPGSGPRHLVVHPSARYVYVINELTNNVGVFAWNPSAGALVQRQSISTLPVGTTVANSTAEIAVHPTGRYVYGSNRGHDSIAVFSVDARDGRLTALGHTPTGGKAPRNFAIDPSGRWLLAANQLSDNIHSFAIDPQKGTLTSTGATLAVARPVCILFAGDAKGS